MSNFNIEEWSPGDVADWLSGLESIVSQYVPMLKQKGLDGRRLLMLRCDDLEYLGIYKIGHQEVLLEAVEQLRDFQYELKSASPQKLALVVSALARALERSLVDEKSQRLPTQTLADIAYLLSHIKPLLCWLDSAGGSWWRWGGVRGVCVRVCVEVCTCAVRGVFAEGPCGWVRSRAQALASLATRLAQGEVPSSLARPRLTIASVPSPQQTLVAVDGRLVLGYDDQLALRLARRSSRLTLADKPPKRLLLFSRRKDGEECSSSGDEPGEEEKEVIDSDAAHSPPLTPHTRTRNVSSIRWQRRHTVCACSAIYDVPCYSPLWQDLKSCKGYTGSTQINLEIDDDPLYRRDKATSCSTGLESPSRPSTCLGVSFNHPLMNKYRSKNAALLQDYNRSRGKLDKSHSTPAYEFNEPSTSSLLTQTIPESPTTPTDNSPTIHIQSAEKTDQILDFKKSSNQIQEAIEKKTTKFSFEDQDKRVLETINIAMLEHKNERNKDSKANEFRSKLSVPEHVRTIQDEIVNAITKRDQEPPEPPPRPLSTQKPNYRDSLIVRDFKLPETDPEASKKLETPTKTFSKKEIMVVEGDRRALPPLNETPSPPVHTYSSSSSINVKTNLFHTKTKVPKKKNSIVNKGRRLSAAEAVVVATVSGPLLRRERCKGEEASWLPRFVAFVEGYLLDYASSHSSRASSRLLVLCARSASEIRSRPFAFVASRPGRAAYYAASHERLRLKWLTALSAPAPLCTDSLVSYSESDSDEPKKDSSKFDSLRKLTSRLHRADSHERVASSANSLDRNYLRFFTRTKPKTDKAKVTPTPVPTEHYRSYRRVPRSEISLPLQDEDINKLAPEIAKKIPTPINYIHASNPNLLDFEKSDFKPAMLKTAPKKSPKVENFIGFVTLEEFMLKKQEEERRQLYTNRVLMGIERDKKDSNNKKAAKELQKQLDKIVPDVIYGELPTYEVEIPAEIKNRSLPKTPTNNTDNLETVEGIPVSIKGKDGYEKIVYINDKSKDEPPKILPRKPVKTSPDLARKCSLTSAKDLGYEVIYGDEMESCRDLEAGKVTIEREIRSGVDTNPVFLQGECPERFWLNSLKRNDKVHSGVSPPSLPGPKPSARQENDASRKIRPPPPPRPARTSSMQDSARYAHLQCPPTFEPESYTLAERAMKRNKQ